MFLYKNLYINALSATLPGLCWRQCHASWTFAGVSATLPKPLLRRCQAFQKL